MMTTNLPLSMAKAGSSDIVLAHDSFTQQGGAERVFSAMRELFPESDVYTLVKDKGYDFKTIGWKIITSPLQILYNIYPHFQA